MISQATPASVTWKWVAGVTVSLLVLGGGGWLTNMQAQVSDMRNKHEEINRNESTQTADIAVIKEKLRVIEDRQKEQSEAIKETNHKLDELLNKANAHERR